MRVGIAIPSFRGSALIGATLGSILEQTHEDWFCVVVNDGEEDGTRDVVESIGDPRFHYVCDGRRRGQLANFNRAIVEALKHDPDVVRLLCADDLLYPHNLAEVVRIFEANPRVGIVSTHFDGIDGDGRLVFRVSMADRDDIVMAGRKYLLDGVAVGNTIGGPSSVAIRREAFETAGLFDTRLSYAGDSDLWHRIAAHWDVAWVGRRAGFQYRQHDGSVTARDRYTVEKFTDFIQVVRRVASTEVMFGPRWWVHQYTIGRLHAVNLQVVAAMAARRRWDGVKAGLVGSFREGLVVYAPFWLPRLPLQFARLALGKPAVRRVIWRRVHEGLQPPRLPAATSEAGGGGKLLAGPERPTGI